MRSDSKLKLLLQRPGEMLDRVGIKLESKLATGEPGMSGKLIREGGGLADAVAECLGSEGESALREHALAELEVEIAERLSRPANSVGFCELHNGSVTLGRLCYSAARRLRPEYVVETGVARGVTTAYVLAALRENGKGRLLSIDLPPLAREQELLVGCAVPEALRERWTLHRGTARALLGQVLAECNGQTGLFVHDSLHTHRNMLWEMTIAHGWLRRPGMVIADDVDCNRAFEEFVALSRPAKSGVLREEGKAACCGYALFEAE